jgi:hypothetical protein
MKQTVISYTIARFDPENPEETYKAVLHNKRAFTEEKDSINFCKKLHRIKLKLAFRCAGLRFKREGLLYGNYGRLAKDARKAAEKNTYKLAVQIVTQ